MANALNLIGKKFGHLTVIERAENNKNGNTQWLCMCDCGNKKVALGYDLNHGRTTTCGCSINLKGKEAHNRESLVGQKFNTLTVVSLNEKKTKNGVLYYNCLCDCGKQTIVSAGNLRSKHVTSHVGCPLKISHNRKDLTGMRFGRLVVDSLAKKTEKGIEWLCTCDCGNHKIVYGKYLLDGTTKSCGCLLEESRRKTKKKTHGLSKKRIYKEFRSMHSRCSPKYHNRSSYYDKGIRVADEWCGENGFENFSEWAFNNGYDDELTLDRIDNSKGYSKDNCRWVSNLVQQNNRDCNVYITLDGETKTMKEWSDYFGLNYGMVKQRHRLGWDINRLFEPSHR